ncbi:MAG: SRPBCC domain-containing protein [Chitinophagales bacterium]
MKAELETQIIIRATPQQVWSVFANFQEYPQWNPFIKSISGIVAKGNRIEAHIQPAGGTAMTFKPTVLTFEPNRELRWLGKLLVTGLFDGEHRFQLLANPNGTTTFLHSEKFSGILVGLFMKSLQGPTRKGFELMNEKLKERVEASLH